MRRKITLLVAVAVLTMMVASGCALADLIVNNDTGPAPTPSFTPRPTFTPTTPATIEPIVAPTFTPTATPEATPTPVDTPTPEVPPTPEPTPTPETARLVINNPTLNVRSGPGTNYGTIGQARNGERYDVLGKNAASSWYQISFNGQTGWVAGQYVIVEGDANSIQVAANIPAPPVQPTRPPAPAPAPQPPAPVAPAPAPAPAPSFPWQYVQGSAIAAPQCGVPNFGGQIRYADGNPQNGVCVLIDYYGPRQVKFSGSGGQGDGNWGFSPCGADECRGVHKVYVVECPAGGVPDGGLSLSPGDPAPAQQSDIFQAEITDKCTLGQWTNIIFQGTR